MSDLDLDPPRTRIAVAVRALFASKLILSATGVAGERSNALAVSTEVLVKAVYVPMTLSVSSLTVPSNLKDSPRVILSIPIRP